MAGGIPRLFAGTGVLPGEGGTEGLADAPVDIASPDAIDSPSDAPEGDIAGDGVATDQTDFAVDNSKAPKQNAFKAMPGTSETAGEGLVKTPEDEEEQAEAAEAAQAAEFSPEILEQAKRYNIDEESAKRYGSPENLQWAMAERDRVAAEWGQKQIAAMLQGQQAQQPAAPQQTQQPPAAAPQAQPTAAEQQQAAQQILAGYKFDRAALAAKGFDDDTLDVLEGMAGHFNGELAKANQHIQTLAQSANQITGQAQAEEEARFVQAIDECFDGLTPEWHELFGKGTGESLRGKPQLTERQKVFSTIVGLQVADAQSNQPRNPPLSELFQSAINALHFNKKQEIARKALAEKAGQRRTQTLARGGSHRTPQMTGEEKAIARAQKFAQKHRLESAIG